MERLIQRVVGAKNTLPAVEVEAVTIMAFKRLLERHMEVQGMEGYGSCTADEISSSRHHVQHKHWGPKGLFQCCTVPCTRQFHYFLIKKKIYVIIVFQMFLWFN